MKNFLFILLLPLLWGCNSTPKQTAVEESFSFVFLTDLHLNNGENGCFEGVQNALNKAKEVGAEFIITGGDNADIDVIKKDSEAAHQLISKLSDIYSASAIPVYPTMGNHDRFWECDEDDPLYNKGLFEKHIHKSYYSFDHKGWHFIILNTVETCEGSYCVGEEQLAWLEKDIAKLDANTPIIVSCHVPFISVSYNSITGKTDRASGMFSNFKQVWNLFNEKNLKLVLQGHQHLYEEIKVMNVQFITGGAVSASWWSGNYHGTEEGFVKITVTGDDFDWEYIDYGWEALSSQK